MKRLGLTIGSFAPAVGLPGRGRQFAKVAAWMNQLRHEHGYWLQGFPLRGCLDTEVKFNSIEGPWCGLDHVVGGWRFRPEQYHSLSHRLQAKVVLRLYDDPANVSWWLSKQPIPHIVSTLAELLPVPAVDYPVWLELGPGMGCGINELLDFLAQHDVPGTFSPRVVYDTLHASELQPALTDSQLAALLPYTGLIHWQPSRLADANGQSEIDWFLRGEPTESVMELLRLRSLPGGDRLPIVLEPSLHHWRQLGGPRCWLSVEWIKARLLECLDILNGHLG